MLKLREVGARGGAVVGALSGLFIASVLLAPGASAQGEDPGLEAITGFGTKVTTYGGALIAVVVIAAGLMLAAKYVRKAAAKG